MLASTGGRTTGGGARQSVASDDAAAHASKRFALVVTGAALLANVLAYALSLYDLAWTGEALHSFTLSAIAFGAAHVLRRDLLGARAVRFFLIILAIGIAVGALWEIAEWAYDAMTLHANSIKGKDDTMWDLVCDSTGAAAAAMLAMRYR